MTDSPSNFEKTPKRTRKAFHESATLASWVFGGLILIFLMLVVFVEVPPSKFPIIRFLMALSAGFFAYFFVGGVLLKGTLRGLFISATGGFVLFILIQFVFDPFQVLPTSAISTSTPVSTPTPIATRTESPKPGMAPPSSKSQTPPNLSQANAPVTGPNKMEEIEIRKTLGDAESLIQTGNASDKEKALQLYRKAVGGLNRQKLNQGLLAGAEKDYAQHYNDNARDKYKALLEAYLRTNSSALQP